MSGLKRDWNNNDSNNKNNTWSPFGRRRSTTWLSGFAVLNIHGSAFSALRAGFVSVARAFSGPFSIFPQAPVAYVGLPSNSPGFPGIPSFQGGLPGFVNRHIGALNYHSGSQNPSPGMPQNPPLGVQQNPSFGVQNDPPSFQNGYPSVQGNHSGVNNPLPGPSNDPAFVEARTHPAIIVPRGPDSSTRAASGEQDGDSFKSRFWENPEKRERAMAEVRPQPLGKATGEAEFLPFEFSDDEIQNFTSDELEPGARRRLLKGMKKVHKFMDKRHPAWDEMFELEVDTYGRPSRDAPSWLQIELHRLFGTPLNSKRRRREDNRREGRIMAGGSDTVISNGQSRPSDNVEKMSSSLRSLWSKYQRLEASSSLLPSCFSSSPGLQTTSSLLPSSPSLSSSPESPPKLPTSPPLEKQPILKRSVMRPVLRRLLKERKARLQRRAAEQVHLQNKSLPWLQAPAGEQPLNLIPRQPTQLTEQAQEKSSMFSSGNDEDQWKLSNLFQPTYSQDTTEQLLQGVISMVLENDEGVEQTKEIPCDSGPQTQDQMPITLEGAQGKLQQLQEQQYRNLLREQTRVKQQLEFVLRVEEYQWQQQLQQHQEEMRQMFPSTSLTQEEGDTQALKTFAQALREEQKPVKSEEEEEEEVKGVEEEEEEEEEELQIQKSLAPENFPPLPLKETEAAYPLVSVPATEGRADEKTPEKLLSALLQRLPCEGETVNSEDGRWSDVSPEGIYSQNADPLLTDTAMAASPMLHTYVYRNPYRPHYAHIDLEEMNRLFKGPGHYNMPDLTEPVGKPDSLQLPTSVSPSTLPLLPTILRSSTQRNTSSSIPPSPVFPSSPLPSLSPPTPSPESMPTPTCFTASSVSTPTPATQPSTQSLMTATQPPTQSRVTAPQPSIWSMSNPMPETQLSTLSPSNPIPKTQPPKQTVSIAVSRNDIPAWPDVTIYISATQSSTQTTVSFPVPATQPSTRSTMSVPMPTTQPSTKSMTTSMAATQTSTRLVSVLIPRTQPSTQSPSIPVPVTKLSTQSMYIARPATQSSTRSMSTSMLATQPSTKSMSIPRPATQLSTRSMSIAIPATQTSTQSTMSLPMPASRLSKFPSPQSLYPTRPLFPEPRFPFRSLSASQLPYLVLAPNAQPQSHEFPPLPSAGTVHVQRPQGQGSYASAAQQIPRRLLEQRLREEQEKRTREAQRRELRAPVPLPPPSQPSQSPRPLRGSPFVVSLPLQQQQQEQSATQQVQPTPPGATNGRSHRGGGSASQAICIKGWF